MLSLDAGLRVATLLCVMQLMTTNSLDGTSQDPKISLLNDLEVLNRLYDRMMPGETDSDIFQIQCNTLRHTWHYANENGTTECMRNVACRFLPPLTNIQHEYANSCNTMIEVLCLLTDINYDIKVVEQEGIGQGVLLGGRPSYLNDPEVFSWLNRTFVTVYSSD